MNSILKKTVFFRKWAILSRIFPCILITLVSTSCNWDNADDLKPPPTSCDSSYTFTGIINITQTYCNFQDCHNAGSIRGDYTTYEGLKEKVDSGTLNLRLFVFADMPPASSPGPSPVADCDLARIKKWMNDGAPR